MIIDKWDIELWRIRSTNGEVCGILGCPNEPIIKCNHCGNHYCAEHAGVIKTFGHPQPQTKELQK